jgi:hypothetical protein
MEWRCQLFAIYMQYKMQLCLMMHTIEILLISIQLWRISGIVFLLSQRSNEVLIIREVNHRIIWRRHGAVYHSMKSFSFSRNQVYNNTGVNILSMIGFEKITAPFPAVEMNSFRNNRAVGELNQQLFDRFVFISLFIL